MKSPDEPILSFSSAYLPRPTQSYVLTNPFMLKVAIHAAPRRSDFYHRLSEGSSVEELDGELAKWLSGLDAVIRHGRAFLSQGGYGTV
jgi:hypothetical protein